MKPDLTTLREIAELQQRLHDAVVGVEFTEYFDSLSDFWGSYCEEYSLSPKGHVRFVDLTEVSRDGRDLFLECIRKSRKDINFAKKVWWGRTYRSYPPYVDCGANLSQMLESLLEDDSPKKVPLTLLCAFVGATRSQIQTEWGEAIHILNEDYSTHPNANQGYAASIMRKSYLDRVASNPFTGVFSTFKDPREVFEPFFHRVEEYYELLNPSGFGIVRSMMQKKGSKTHFNTVMHLLNTMRHDEEFWNVYVPYVKQVMDRTWKISHREFSKLDGFDRRLCGELVLVWKFSTDKLLRSLHNEGLPGNPLAFVFKIPGWASSYGDNCGVYPSVEVLTVHEVRSDILPPTACLPNLKTVLSGNLLRDDYMSRDFLKRRYPDADLSSGDGVTKFIEGHFA